MRPFFPTRYVTVEGPFATTFLLLSVVMSCMNEFVMFYKFLLRGINKVVSYRFCITLCGWLTFSYVFWPMMNLTFPATIKYCFTLSIVENVDISPFFGAFLGHSE